MGERQEHYYIYHVCSIGKDGKEKELFRLEEYGMNLDRAPKLLADEKYLYILFEGLDNEDLEERLYEGEVQVDIQGFLPVLYRYEMLTGKVEKVKLEKENVSLLVDAFTWQGETAYLESRYKGLIGGLNLGFYFEDGYYLSDFGRGELRLTGEGGMKTTGCLMGDEYYICSREGVCQFHLMTKKVKLIVPMDLRDCIRVEIQSLTVDGIRLGE